MSSGVAEGKVKASWQQCRPGGNLYRAVGNGVSRPTR